jgi:hypothetical protein
MTRTIVLALLASTLVTIPARAQFRDEVMVAVEADWPRCPRSDCRDQDSGLKEWGTDARSAER